MVLGRGRRPLSPVHVRGRREGSGDVSLSWVRRTRIGGDGWAQSEVPLGEASERYEIDVFSGAIRARTMASSSPSIGYPASQQIADFGALPSALDIAVHQMSAGFGRGSPARVTLTL